MSASFFWISWFDASGRPELLAIERVLRAPRGSRTPRAQRAPGDPVARAVEAAERTGQAPARSAAGSLRDEHSSITISPVIDARSENLPSIFGADRPFMPFSRMKPRIRPSSFFAHTTNTSAIGAFEIHIFAPCSL
jgi:hypothetical protein